MTHAFALNAYKHIVHTYTFTITYEANSFHNRTNAVLLDSFLEFFFAFLLLFLLFRKLADKILYILISVIQHEQSIRTAYLQCVNQNRNVKFMHSGFRVIGTLSQFHNDFVLPHNIYRKTRTFFIMHCVFEAFFLSPLSSYLERQCGFFLFFVRLIYYYGSGVSISN